MLEGKRNTLREVTLLRGLYKQIPLPLASIQMKWASLQQATPLYG